MTDAVEKLKIRDHSGNPVDVELKLSDFAEAASVGLNLTQYLNLKHADKTNIEKYGDVLAQFMLSSGLYTRTDAAYGIRPPRVSDVMNGTLKPVGPANMPQVAGIIRNDGSDRTLAGRMLYMEVVMRTIESELRETHEDLFGGWNSMIAQTETVNLPKFEQPIINVKAPESIRSMPIAQLQEPNVMVSITTSSVTRTIPTKSIGLLVSDEAQSATSIDLINIILTSQARGQRLAMVLEDINAIVEGSVDRGESAKATYTAQSLDAGVTTAGTISHDAYIKYLHKYRRKMSVSHMMMSMSNALAFNRRANKPTANTVLVRDPEGFDQSFTVENLEGRPPRLLILDDGVISANKVVGLDSRFAMRRVINVAANYSAMEEFVLRRGKAFRFDFGEVTHTLMADAFNCMTLTV